MQSCPVSRWLPPPLSPGEECAMCMERVGIRKKNGLGWEMRDWEILIKRVGRLKIGEKKRATVCSQSQLSPASLCNKHNKRGVWVTPLHTHAHTHYVFWITTTPYNDSQWALIILVLPTNPEALFLVSLLHLTLYQRARYRSGSRWYVRRLDEGNAQSWSGSI